MIFAFLWWERKNNIWIIFLLSPLYKIIVIPKNAQTMHLVQIYLNEFFVMFWKNYDFQCIFDTIEKNLLHLLSSDPSAQSYAPSQTLFLGIQSPFAQVASYKPQAVGGRNVGRGSPVITIEMWNYLICEKNIFAYNTFNDIKPWGISNFAYTMLLDNKFDSCRWKLKFWS